MTDYTLTYHTPMLHPLAIEGEVVLPELFTYPFLYTPHPLAIAACEDLKAYVRAHTEWTEEISLGKMFGVLVVQSDKGIYSLWAFSGLLERKCSHEGFVPPVYDVEAWQKYYNSEDSIICSMPDCYEKSERSRKLQMHLFEQFNFLNARGEIKNIIDIFDKEACRIPPTGAGECCAPKLLQYAYNNGLKPLCMAEFWLGMSPKGDIRYDGQYYPACHAKCKPILKHMLTGLNVEENPLLISMREQAKLLRIIYEDDAIIVVNKPAGMLAVNGNVDAPSVESIIKENHPDISGPMIVHRLDMDTSGIMIIAKNKDIHKALQTQFFRHDIKKRYVAILDGVVNSDKGTVSLPIMPDNLHRPRQKVDFVHGKDAITEYEVLERTSNTTRIALFPLTGRTHQLRIHAAHEEGLNCPILGDRLYSHTKMINSMTDIHGRNSRMYLHAESIDFIHPISLKRMHLSISADF